MQNHFLTGAIVAYFGYLICLAEVYLEPLLREKSRRKFRIAAIALVMLICGAFTYSFVISSPPPCVMAYSMSTLPSGVAGLEQNQKFTYLEVAINNPTSGSIHDLNVLVDPDTWVREGQIIKGSPDCEISRAPGKSLAVGRVEHLGTGNLTTNNVFGSLELHDSLGNPFTIQGSHGGYKLSCNNLRPQSTIQIILICETFIKEATALIPPTSSQPGLSMELQEFKNQPQDFLGPRPFPSLVHLEGHYKTWSSRLFSISTNVKVDTQN